MNDRENLDFDHLLTCDAKEFLAAITPMSADDCEHCARAILDRIGGPSFEQYLMRIVETMVPKDGSGPPTNSEDYYFAVRDLFPNISTEDDVLGRLAAFVMRMCQLRFEAHMSHQYRPAK